MTSKCTAWSSARLLVSCLDVYMGEKYCDVKLFQGHSITPNVFRF